MPQILTWSDGDIVPTLVRQIQSHMLASWQTWFPGEARLEFVGARNLKSSVDLKTASNELQAIAFIRNPDVFFELLEPRHDLGGIEITVHSPDGSNADKRYPYLWASRRHGLDAFVVCPYRKTRTQGANNQLPFRHAQRNRSFAEKWNVGSSDSRLRQILPITDLQTDIASLPGRISRGMWSSELLGEFFALRTAQFALGAPHQDAIKARLGTLRAALLDLIGACEENTTRTEPSTLVKESDRWVQVYNSRPDSGHWERGEGQFDSIDGRLMFTLDEIDLLPPALRPKRLEFWLPQMVREHPWISEQINRGYGSKRFRNIMQTLDGSLEVRFAGDLTCDDWALLHRNPQLCLERLDWNPGIFRIQDVVAGRNIDELAGAGLRGASSASIRAIRALLSNEHLHFSSHRATRSDWPSQLVIDAQNLSSGQTLLVPRIPQALLRSIGFNTAANVVPAEGMSKDQLLALRQLHRAE